MNCKFALYPEKILAFNHFSTCCTHSKYLGEPVSLKNRIFIFLLLLEFRCCLHSHNCSTSTLVSFSSFTLSFRCLFFSSCSALLLSRRFYHQSLNWSSYMVELLHLFIILLKSHDLSLLQRKTSSYICNILFRYYALTVALIPNDTPRGSKVVNVALNIHGCFGCCGEIMMVVKFMGNRERTNRLV